MTNRNQFSKITIFICLGLASLTFIYPFYWMILASFTNEVNIGKLTFIPSQLTIDNYAQMIAKINIWRALINSVTVALLTTGGVIVFSSMCGYALAKLNFKGKNILFYAILFTMTLPFQITLIPNYIIMVKLHWIDTFLALIIPALNNAFAILLFRQAFMNIPDALIHAARIDGCNEWTIVFRILMPNVKPTIITVGIITFMNSWNDVMWPLIVIRNEALMTMPQMVTLFAVGGRAEAQLGVKLAAAVLLALPVMIAYIIFQKHFIRSMAASGLKD
jgi:multiple sugar transport system permease protein